MVNDRVQRFPWDYVGIVECRRPVLLWLRENLLSTHQRRLQCNNGFGGW